MSKLSIMYLTDNNYAAFAGVSITSLFMNNSSINDLIVYIIDDNISSDNKRRLLLTAKDYGHEIVFLDLTEGIKVLEEIDVPKYRNSYTTYLKLFAFGMLPDDCHRVLFIDSDSVVVSDLGEMVDFDFCGNTIAAVRDGLSQTYKLGLGYGYDDPWFNMGVMLVDVDRWKASGAEDRIIQQLSSRRAYISVDQDLLNITQHGNIATLHPRYNATAHHYVYKPESFLKAFPQGNGFYCADILEESQNNPAIRHFERFVGESAWNENTVHPYAVYFDEYLKNSRWSDYIKRPSNLHGVLRFERFLYKVIPHNVFVYIFGIGFRWYLKRMNKELLLNESPKNIC